MLKNIPYRKEATWTQPGAQLAIRNCRTYCRQSLGWLHGLKLPSCVRTILRRRLQKTAMKTLIICESTLSLAKHMKSTMQRLRGSMQEAMCMLKRNKPINALKEGQLGLIDTVFK